MSDDFHLKWHDHHDLFFSAAEHLCQGDFLTDVTLSCGGRYFSAHKLVLCVCSGYFAELFASRRAPPFTQTIVYLKDVDPVHLELILAYMYRGEISVGQNDLIELLHAAKGLRVRGLTEASEMDVPSMHAPGREANGRRKPMVVHSKKDALNAKKMEVEDRWSGAQDESVPASAGADIIARADRQQQGYDDDYYAMPTRGRNEYDRGHDMDSDSKADLVLPDDRTCPDCGHRFFNARTLKRHRLIHSKETPFGCFYCSYATNRRDALMTHCVSQHEMDPEEFKAKAKQHFVSKPRGRKRKIKEDENMAEEEETQEQEQQEQEQPEQEQGQGQEQEQS